MSNITVEQTVETTPLKSTFNPPPPSYASLHTVGRTAGTTFFLISTLIAAVIPALELGIGIYYNGKCPIDQRIATYMTVAGVGGLILVALAIILALTFLCFIRDSTTLSVSASFGIGFNVVVSTIISIFLLIWFFFGCVWVFGAADFVQFHDPFKITFCAPVLYQCAFALLIITFVWVLIQCCITCFRVFYINRHG